MLCFLVRAAPGNAGDSSIHVAPALDGQALHQRTGLTAYHGSATASRMKEARSRASQNTGQAAPAPATPKRRSASRVRGTWNHCVATITRPDPPSSAAVARAVA